MPDLLEKALLKLRVEPVASVCHVRSVRLVSIRVHAEIVGIVTQQLKAKTLNHGVLEKDK